MLKKGTIISIIFSLTISLLLFPFSVYADEITGFDYTNYYELNYLESDGNSYIDTQILYSSSLNFEINGTVSYGSTSAYALMGTTNSGNTLSVWVGTRNNTYVFVNSSVCDSSVSADNNFHTFKVEGFQFTFDGTYIGSVGSSYPNNYIWLFRRYTPNNSSPLNGSSKIKYFRTYDSNGNNTHYFVPAERKSDNVLGMYDTIDGIFYINSGSGTFISGGRIPFQYTLTLSVSPDGSGSVLNGGIYEYGDSVQIGAIPNNGYEFSKWSDDNTDNPRTLTITQNTSLTAIFVTSSSSGGEGGGEGGGESGGDSGGETTTYYTVSGSTYPSGSGTIVGLGRYEEGTVIIVSASANQGYTFNSWSDGNTDNPRTYTVNSNIDVIANFNNDNSTVSSSWLLGINANTICLDTYGDSITLPRITYTQNSITGSLNGYLVSTGSGGSYDLSSSNSISGNANGLTFSYNVGGYLSSNSNININNVTKVLTEYEFILDNYYCGSVVISDGTNQFVRYVNGNRFIYNTANTTLDTESFTIVSSNLQMNPSANNLDILVNGTNSSNTSSFNLNTSTSDLNDSIYELVNIENDFNDDLNSSLQNVDINNNIPSAMGSKFLTSANWVRTQFNRMTNNTPFGSVLGFSLVLGISLLIIGKVFK